MDLAFKHLRSIQNWLEFEGCVSPVFTAENGIGRHGIAGLAVGSVFGFSLCAVLMGAMAGILSVPLLQWFGYFVLLAVFHGGEWYVTAAYRPSQLGYDSWIIAHSIPYTAVFLASQTEFWLEFFLLPSLKGHLWLVLLSGVLSVVAIGIRIVGMAHCGDSVASVHAPGVSSKQRDDTDPPCLPRPTGENFDHIVMQERKEGHQLVTDGIYRYLRHPSYFGFFYWSITAQLLLGNPVMVCACAFASYRFFQGRIGPEEEVLVKAYGEQYKEFCKRTPIGIPLVTGAVAYEGPAAAKAK